MLASGRAPTPSLALGSSPRPHAIVLLLDETRQGARRRLLRRSPVVSCRADATAPGIRGEQRRATRVTPPLLVLEPLQPTERLAWGLHDLFAVSAPPPRVQGPAPPQRPTGIGVVYPG